MNKGIIKNIGLAQINPKVGDIKGNTLTITDYIKKASASKIDVLIFLEKAITGYPVQDLMFTSGFVEQNLQALDFIIKRKAHACR